MKVVVRHYGIVETAVEVNDKFNHLRGFNFNSTKEQEDLMDELLGVSCTPSPQALMNFIILLRKMEKFS